MKKYRFLSIDDSKAIHAFLEQCLEPIMASIDHAMNGQEGLDMVIANPGKYDVIILDWEMPVMDGPTTFKKLVEAKNTVPVFMLTSKNDPSDIVQMIEAGVEDYILKPFTAEIIIEKIKLALGE